MSQLVFNLPFALIFTGTINGTHFLGGTITWHLQNTSATGTPVAIIITQTYSWTYTSAVCTNSMIATNQPVPSSAGSLICLPSCPSGFGTVSAVSLCTDVSPLNGITVGQRLDTISLPAGSNFSVAFQGSAWGSLTTGGTTWSISSHINLATRSDTGKYNNAPVSTMMSPINIQLNETKIITVPVSDGDGDIIRCRWATSSNGIDECGSVCPPSSLPPNTTIHPDCTIVITGYTVGTKFAIGLMVEDFMNSTSTTPLSSVPVQFIVKVVVPMSCLSRPEVILLAESCTPLKVNQTFTSTLLAINNCGTNVNITDIATLSFSGMIQSAVIKLNSITYYKNLTWVPTMKQLGYQVMCAMALDSQNLQSSQYCFTFYVTENGGNTCPGILYNTTATTPITTTSVTTISIISTTTLSTLKAGEPNNWPLIGSLIGLTLLIVFAISCCLVCRHYNRSGVNRCRKWYKSFKIDKTHDNELCIDPPPSFKSSPNFSPVTAKTNLISTISDKRTISSTRKIDNRVRQKATSSTSVTKSQTVEATSTILNLTSEQEKEKDPSIINSYAEKNDQVFRMKSKSKRRSSSFDRQTSQQHQTKNTSAKTLGRRSSAGDIDFLRITQVLSHPKASEILPVDYIRPSIIENTIQLDRDNETINLPHSIKTTNQDKVRVKNVVSRALRMTPESRASQIDTINLTPTIPKVNAYGDNNETQSVNAVRIGYVKIPKKKLKTIIVMPLLKPLVEEQKNNNNNNEELSGLNVNVDHVAREKRRHH